MPVMPPENFSAYLEAKGAEEPDDPVGTPSSNQPADIAKRVKNEFMHQLKVITALMDGAAKDKSDETEDEKQATQGELEAAVKELLTLKRKKVIAGIEVGGKKILPPGTTLHKGIIVGGPREKLIATIARSDGYSAPEEELAKHSIKNTKELETIKKEVERLAKGEKWQIDVVETPRGTEYRGIIGDPKKAKKSSKGKDKSDGEEEEIGEDEELVWEDGDELGEDDGSEETYREDL
jgi:protein OS-9